MTDRSHSTVHNRTIVRSFRHLFAIIQLAWPGAAASLAAQLFTLPRRFRRPQRERFFLENAKRAKILCGKGLITTWTWGESYETVLLIHGWEGRGGQLGALAAPLVEAGYQVVAFDAPGHGESFGYQTNLIDFAETVLCLGARYLSLRAVVAHSFGAAATTLALSRGLDANCTVFLAPPARFDHYMKLFSEMFGLSALTLARMIERFERKFALRWSELNPVQHASSMQIPLLAIHDQNDSEVPWDHSRELGSVWPGSKIITTTGLGHRRILRDAGVVASIVEFVEQNSSWGVRPITCSESPQTCNEFGTTAP